jgi:type II secretory pathway pseudopilin PulG
MNLIELDGPEIAIPTHRPCRALAALASRWVEASCHKKRPPFGGRSIRRHKSADAGFTLVEVTVAFAILSAAGLLIGTISDGVTRISNAKRMVVAGSIAQSLLASVGTESPLRDTTYRGQIENGFHWKITAERFGNLQDQQAWPNAAYKVLVEVWWGPESGEPLYRQSTLRLGSKELR